MLEQVRAHPNLITGVGDWVKIVLVDSVAFDRCNGKSFQDIATERGDTPFDVAMDVLRADVEHLLRPMVLLRTYTEEMLRTTYQHTGCMPGSDATTLAPDGVLADEKFHGAYTWAAWDWQSNPENVTKFASLLGLPVIVVLHAGGDVP